MNIKAELENKRIDMERLKEEHREQLNKVQRDYDEYYQGESNNYKEREHELVKAKETLEGEVNKYKTLYSNLMKKSIASEMGGVAEKMRANDYTSNNNLNYASSMMNRLKSPEANKLFSHINDIKFSELSMNFSQLEREQQELKNMTKNMFSKNNTVKISHLREKEMQEKGMLLTSLASTFPSNLGKDIGFHTFNDFNKNNAMKNNFFVDANANENKINSAINHQIEQNVNKNVESNYYLN